VGGVDSTAHLQRGLKVSLVDNSFAVPGADNCGTEGLLDSVVDVRNGLPSAAGWSTPVPYSSSYTPLARLVREHVK